MTADRRSPKAVLALSSEACVHSMRRASCSRSHRGRRDGPLTMRATVSSRAECFTGSGEHLCGGWLLGWGDGGPSAANPADSRAATGLSARLGSRPMSPSSPPSPHPSHAPFDRDTYCGGSCSRACSACARHGSVSRHSFAVLRGRARLARAPIQVNVTEYELSGLAENVAVE